MDDAAELAQRLKMQGSQKEQERPGDRAERELQPHPPKAKSLQPSSVKDLRTDLIDVVPCFLRLEDCSSALFWLQGLIS